MSNLAVKITADIVDLQQKFSVAKAELQGMESQVRALARAQAEGSAAADPAKFQQLTAAMLAQRQVVGGLAGDLTKAGVSLGSVSRAAESMSHGGLSTATREFRALFDELSSGRTRMTPGTLAIIAQRVLGLGPAALGAVAGVTALAAGIGYLVVRAVEAAEALQKIKIGADFAGNLNLTQASIQQFVTQLSSAATVSTKEADTIGEALARVPGMATQTFAALSSMIPSYLQATGQDAGKVATQLAQIFSQSETATKLASSLGGITQAQREMAEAADKSGNAFQIQAAKLDLLSTATNRTAEDAAKLNSTMATGSWSRDLSNMGTYLRDMIIDNDTTEAATTLLKQNTAASDANAESVRKRIAELRSMPASSDSTLQSGIQAAQSEDPTSQQVQAATAKIQQMTAALAVAKQQGDQVDVKLLNAGLAQAQQELHQLQFGPIIEQMEKANETARAYGEAQKQLADQEIQEANQSLNAIVEAQKQASEQATAIARQDADSSIQLSRMKLEAEKDSLDQEVSATSGAAEAKYTRLKQLTEQLYALDLQQLENEEATVKDEPVEYDRVCNQIRELKQKLVLDLAALDKEAAASNQKQVRQQSEAWRSATAEIESIESRLVSDLFNRRQSLTQSLIQLSGQLVEKEITNDLKAETSALMAGNSQQAQQKALEQGGLLTHLQIEMQKMAATTASQNAQTQATVVGSATRQTAQTTAAAQGTAAQAAIGAKSVMSSAAQAFAGTYASVAQIPVVGVVLAPIAASAAFAAVAGYESLASLDVGAWNVPHDMVAQIHQGETVVPATFAQGMRSSGFGQGDGGDGGGDTHVHLHMGNSIDAKSFGKYVNQAPQRSALAKAMRTHLGR